MDAKFEHGLALIRQGLAILEKSSKGEPVELHAIWNRKVENPALARLLAELEYAME